MILFMKEKKNEKEDLRLRLFKYKTIIMAAPMRSSTTTAAIAIAIISGLLFLGELNFPNLIK